MNKSSVAIIYFCLSVILGMSVPLWAADEKNDYKIVRSQTVSSPAQLFLKKNNSRLFGYLNDFLTIQDAVNFSASCNDANRTGREAMLRRQEVRLPWVKGNRRLANILVSTFGTGSEELGVRRLIFEDGSSSLVILKPELLKRMSNLTELSICPGADPLLCGMLDHLPNLAVLNLGGLTGRFGEEDQIGERHKDVEWIDYGSDDDEPGSFVVGIIELADKDLHRLSELKHLSTLDLSDNPSITNDVLSYLPPRLTSLNLKSTGVSVSGLAAIEHMTELVHLNLSLSCARSSDPIREGSCKNLSAFTRMRELNLRGWSLTDIEKLLPLKDLRELELEAHPLLYLEANGFPTLRQLPKLTQVSVYKLSFAQDWQCAHQLAKAMSENQKNDFKVFQHSMRFCQKMLIGFEAALGEDWGRNYEIVSEFSVEHWAA